MGVGAGALGGKSGQRRKKVWVKMGKSYPFIEATKAERLPTGLLRIAYFPSATIDGSGVITHTRIDENPVIRGHDLCFDKTCQGNRLAMRAVAGCEKTVRIMTWL